MPDDVLDTDAVEAEIVDDEEAGALPQVVGPATADSTIDLPDDHDEAVALLLDALATAQQAADS